MVSSRAIPRMRAANPNEFEPKTLYFSTSPLGDKIDWRNCFPEKASAVYSSITGTEVDEQSMFKASKLLIYIAQYCTALIVSSRAKESSVPLLNLAAPVVATPSGITTGEALEDLREDIMKAIDGVYLVVGFLFDLKVRVESDNWNREKVDSRYLSDRKQDVVKDIVKIDNQLPLDLIVDVVEQIEEAIKRSKDSLLQEKLVGEKDPLLSSLENFKLGFTKDTFYEVLDLFTWYFSPFYSQGAKANKELHNELPKKQHLLECLHSILVSSSDIPSKEWNVRVRPTPTARLLVRSGIRFMHEDDGKVQLQFSQPCLRVPALVYDFKLETVARNLLAWECLIDVDQKPVTRYFQLLNELADEAADVRVMQRSGILRGGWKRVDEVVDLVKRVDGFASHPSLCPIIDKEIEKMVEFYEKRMENFFVRNQPAVVWASSVAAISVLLTAIVAIRRMP